MRIYEIGVKFNGETYHIGMVKCTLHAALETIYRLRSQNMFNNFTLRSYCI